MRAICSCLVTHAAVVRHDCPCLSTLLQASPFGHHPPVAPPSPGLQQLGGLVSKNMPVVNIHAADVPADSPDLDHSALDLLYHTDAYNYSLEEHCNSKRESLSRTMSILCFNSDRSHRRLVVIWFACFVFSSLVVA